jgi:hypothetical protein
MKLYPFFFRSIAAGVFLGAMTSVAQTLTVTNDLALWLRADAGVTTNESGVVLQWDDQSTNANNAVAVSETQGPVITANGLNNRPVLRFDGVDDYLDVLDSESLSFTGDLTTLFVIRFADFANYNAVWAKTVGNFPAPTDLYTVPDGAGGARNLRVYRGNGTATDLSTVDTAQPLRPDAFAVLGVDIQGETLTHYFNGQANGSGSVNPNTADGNTSLKIGSRGDLFTKLKGDIAEMLVYSRALSAVERSNAFNYLQTKYNLLNSPPSITISTSPSGPNVNVGDVVRVTANPVDLDGTIARVEFFANGVSAGIVQTPPYAINVRIESSGTATFTARAVDNKDASATSNPVSLTAGPAGTTALPTEGLQLWLRADEGTVLGTGDAVVQWADQSGNANSAAQIDEALAPMLVPNALNGLPVLRFDGVNDFMEVADSDSVSITGDISTFYVAKFADFANFRAVWGKTVANQPAPNDLYAARTSGNPTFFRGNGASGAQAAVGSRPYPANSFIVAGVQVAGTAASHHLSGKPNGTATITTTPVDGNRSLRIGSRDDGGTRMKGDIAEVLIYDRALTAEERFAVQRHLGQKYGLPELTPTNTLPLVAVTSPTGTLQTGAVEVTVDANDPDGAVVAVQIFVNGVLRATDTTAPYSTTVEVPYGGYLVLSAAAIDNLGARGTSPSVTVCVQGPKAPAGLVGYWPLDSNADAQLGPDGVLINNPEVTTDRNGVAGGALMFSGTNFVQISGGAGLSGLTQGSISMWVKWSGLQDAGFGGSYGAVLARQQDGVFSADIINLTAADPNAGAVQWRHASAGATITGTTAVGADTWRHIVVTFSPIHSALYVHGALEGTNFGGALPANILTPLAIGAWPGGGGSFSTAAIDDVAIWNRVLTAGEIDDLVFQVKTPLDLMLQPDCQTIRTGKETVIRWGSDTVLQSAPDLTGPWEDVQGATSPYTVPEGPGQKFYRLRTL